MLSLFDAAELTSTENRVPAVRAGGFAFKCQRGRLSRRAVLLPILLRLTERREAEKKRRRLEKKTLEIGTRYGNFFATYGKRNFFARHTVPVFVSNSIFKLFLSKNQQSIGPERPLP